MNKFQKIEIVGLFYRPKAEQDNIRALDGRSDIPVMFIPEPSNGYDSNAVKVMLAAGDDKSWTFAGYIPKRHNIAFLADWKAKKIDVKTATARVQYPEITVTIPAYEAI